LPQKHNKIAAMHSFAYKLDAYTTILSYCKEQVSVTDSCFNHSFKSLCVGRMYEYLGAVDCIVELTLYHDCVDHFEHFIEGLPA